MRHESSTKFVRHLAWALLLVAQLAWRIAPAQAQAAGEPVASSDGSPPRDGEIVVYGRAIAQIGTAISGSQGAVGYKDFADTPLSRVGELVENVPGVIATQHSGTGKANQYFLRGFNLDHGTDLAGFVDGVPVNMRSHGHGQGYLDLNFLIPELVERIDYRKGPYFADVGDFSAAGTVKFSTVDRLAKPMIQATAGSYGYYRALAAGSTAVAGGELLGAFDGTASDGPWVRDEKLRKVNTLLKYSGPTGDGAWSVGLTGYHARWDSTDQVPLRAVTSGLIGRFGNIDDHLGGATTRIGLTGNGSFGRTDITIFGLYYRFRLTSNFTYFLDDPVNGDEFQQRDQRGVFGGSIRHSFPARLAGIPVTFAIGGDTRYDLIGKVGLYHSVDAAPTATVRQDKVDEWSGALHAEATASLTDRLRLVLGMRGDLYRFTVRSEPLAVNGGSAHAGIFSPKAALAWRAADHLELYADYGESFHSNDVRGATIALDPSSGTPADPVRALIKARGAELGARAEHERLTASIALFYLTLGSELVYSGDGGTTEPNPASRRYGAEATLFWRPFDRLTLNGAVALTHARFHDVAPGQTRIPNSVDRVASAGAEIDLGHGLTASLRLRYLGPAPLIEDDSARSRSTTLVNLGGYYRIGRARLAVDVLNLMGSRDNDITYFYTSRLPGEPAQGIDDYHFHPVEPRQVRVSISYAFD